MNKLIASFLLPILLISCSGAITYKDHNQVKDDQNQSTEEKARSFIQQTASIQYIDYANVIADTAYIGVPSRRGLEHAQDNMARIFLSDMIKSGNFKNIFCCKVINTARDFQWSDTLITGQIIGYADVNTK